MPTKSMTTNNRNREFKSKSCGPNCNCHNCQTISRSQKATRGSSPVEFNSKNPFKK